MGTHMRLHTLTVFAAFGLMVGTAASSRAQQGGHPLDASFQKWDRNKDGFLDADELAKAYRGPNAKAIVDKPGARETHPEHLFMNAWDANKDGKISKAEFEKYENKYQADVKAAANRNRTYTRIARPGYRSPMRHHRGFAGRGRGFGTNPYANLARSYQRAYIQQRNAFSIARRYGAYSPNFRGGYRGVRAHHHIGRRR